MSLKFVCLVSVQKLNLCLLFSVGCGTTQIKILDVNRLLVIQSPRCLPHFSCSSHWPSPWGTGFVPKAVHVQFVVDEVAVGHVSLLELQFFSLSIIPQMLYFVHQLSAGCTLGPKESGRTETYNTVKKSVLD